MRKKFVTIDDVNNSRPDGSVLTAIEFIHKPNKIGKRTRFVKCTCDYGISHELPIYHLNSYKTCCCHRVDNLKKNATKYYPVVPKLLKCYSSMMYRCYNTLCSSYKRYGRKGVIVCDEWKESYQSFLNWALANGYKDGLQLDKDIKGDGKLYSPDTCCWITNLENQRHKSNTVRYEYMDKLLTISEISELTGISDKKIKQRLQKEGTTIIEAIFLIKNNINRRYEK